MPGIVGFLERREHAEIADDLARMLERMKHHPWYVTESHADPASGLALGRLSLGFVNNAPQPVASAAGDLVVVMAGELYDYAEQRRGLEAVGRVFRADSHAEVLLHGYRAGGQKFFASLDGAYVAAIWDAALRQLVLVTDRFGQKPLYYTKTPGRFLFGSEIKTILLDREVDRASNPRGVAQFFTYGQFLCEDTFYSAIRIVPAAGWLTYRAADHAVTVEKYLNPKSTAPERIDKPDEWLDRIDLAFKSAVDRRTLGTRNLGLSLSGGLDARSILAVLDRQRAPVTTICMGMPGSMDHDSARRMAELAGARHHASMLDTAFLSRFEEHLRWMVHLTDGHYLCQVIVMPTLPLYREVGVEVLLRGHAGELMHMHKAYAYSMDRAALAIRDARGLEAWLYRHLQAYMLEDLDQPLFRPAIERDFGALARDSLTEALAEAEGVEPPLQRIWHLFIHQRLRRETSLSMVEFNSLVETRLPFLDGPLFDLLLRTPPELKLGEGIQTHILRKRFPAFLEVRNANTGTRVGASELARKISTFRMRVLAKLGVKGYQPYERLGLWLRRELAPMVKKILLDERCLERGVFSPDAVRAVIDGHNSARKNHTFLLLAMMIYEQGQRQFIDESPTESTPLAAGTGS